MHQSGVGQAKRQESQILANEAMELAVLNNVDALDHLESLNRLLTVEEFAEFSRLSEKTIYRHIRSHRLPAIRVMGRVLLEPRATAAWLRERLN